MKLVLDTNAVSALMKGDPVFIERLKQRSKEEVSVPQPVFAEIAYGIERLPKSKRKEALQERFDLMRSELARSIPPSAAPAVRRPPAARADRRD